MPITRLLFPLALALLLTLAGCRSHRDTARSASHAVTPTTGAATPRYFTSNFACSAEGVAANGQLRMQPDSVIWLSASKIIELGRARFTRDSVIIHAKVMGRCFRGNYDDLYRRFHLRTDFDQLYQTVTADDAGLRIAALARQLGIEATVELQPWKEVDRLTFPIPIPANINPL